MRVHCKKNAGLIRATLPIQKLHHLKNEKLVNGDNDWEARPSFIRRLRQRRIGLTRAERPVACPRCRWNRSRCGILAHSAADSVSGWPTGSPLAIVKTLDFASRHSLVPETEHFPMSQINDPLPDSSQVARYHIVLDEDC